MASRGRLYAYDVSARRLANLTPRPGLEGRLGGPGDPLKTLRTMTDIEQSIFDGVLKLPHISRPVIIEQYIYRIVVEPNAGHPVLFSKIRSKFSKEQMDVFFPVAQGQYPDWNCI